MQALVAAEGVSRGPNGDGVRRSDIQLMRSVRQRVLDLLEVAMELSSDMKVNSESHKDMRRCILPWPAVRTVRYCMILLDFCFIAWFCCVAADNAFF